jgi:O-acetyl-ADP-ribose deacetylase (regulator of RNase III)
MTTWLACVGDILDVSADALICSANPWLNLSGGVGGAFAMRFGDSMQCFLHDWLAERNRCLVAPGDVVIAPSFGSQFKLVVHAVAIDIFYKTSEEIIRRAYENSFIAVSKAGCRTAAAACLATGYGRAPLQTFIAAVRPLISVELPEIDSLSFVSTNAELIAEIQREIDDCAH